MAIDLYGIDEDRYIEIFREKAGLLYRTMREMIRVSLEEQVDLNHWPHETIWRMYESISYDANEEARQITKKECPSKLPDYDLGPTRSELMDEIQNIKKMLDTPE